MKCMRDPAAILPQPEATGQYIEINAPSALIDFLVCSWNTCGKYASKRKPYSTNPMLKNLSVWLILKAQTSSGIIQNYRSQLTQLARICKIEKRMLQYYIAFLRRENLLSIQGKHLVLKSFTALRKYGINTKQREQTIFYDTTNKTTLAEQLIAIAMQRMKNRWMEKYWQKVTNNQSHFLELKNHLIAWLGADGRRLDEDPEYFRDCHLQLLKKTYKEEKVGQESFYLLHKVILANPDLNARQGTYARKVGLQAGQSFAHIKRKLAGKGLITFAKEHIESDYRARKNEQVYHHRYVKQTKKTIWFLPDQITIKNEIIFFKKSV